MTILLTQPVLHPACLQSITFSSWAISFSVTASLHVYTANIVCKSLVFRFQPVHVSKAETVNGLPNEVSRSGLGTEDGERSRMDMPLDEG